MSVALSIATRGRPTLLRQTIEETAEKITLASTQIVVCADADDAPTIDLIWQYGHPVFVSIKEREDSVGAKWNRAIHDLPQHSVYMMTTDYGSVATKGFDQRLLDAADKIPDRLAVLSGRLANLSFPVWQAVTVEVAKIWGGMYPELFPFWFVDHWLDDLAKMIGRTVYCDIDIDCNARRPGSTTGFRDLKFWAAFYDATLPLRGQQAHAAIRQMDEPEWRKQLLINNLDLVKQRSFLINHHCRENSEAMSKARAGESGPPDERYVRLYQRACNIIDLLANKRKAA